MFRGKNYKESAKLIDKSAQYEPAEAFELVTKTAKAKFDETVELHVKLGVDSRHADQQVRGAIVLPNGTGKSVTRPRVLQAGARRGVPRKPAPITSAAWSWSRRSRARTGSISTSSSPAPDMMGVVGRLGKVLGPKGLMPSPKAGTVTPNLAQAIKEAKAGKIEYRLDKTNIIHCPIGKVSFGAEKLHENYTALIGAIIKREARCRQGPVYPQLRDRHHHGPRHQDQRPEAALISDHKKSSNENSAIFLFTNCSR